MGKSYLLRSLRDRWEADPQSNVIFIDKEKKEFDAITNYKDLNDYIDQNRASDRKNFILIDEIQDICEFERSLRAFYEEEDIEIIVTGSNSKMLSGELSTLIGGRYKDIYIQSLSYQEFITFHRLEDNDEALYKYLRFGGLPGLLRTGLNEDDVLEYQSDVLNTVLLKDVILRHQVRNVPFLQNLSRYIADNTGKIISATNIANYMTSTKQPVSAGVILNYLSYICEAYISQKVNRYDIHGKQLFQHNCKYYFQDLGIRNSLVTGVRAFDIEKIIENAVYNHLIHLGYDVRIGQLASGKEIDFVAFKSGQGPVYIQVAYIIASDETYNREFGNLKNIKDHNPKYVISLSPMMDATIDEGIRHISLRRFLSDSDGLW